MLLSQLRPYSSQSTAEQHQQDTVAVQQDQSPPLQRLTKQQKEEVKAALNSCFKQDTAGTAGLLAKSLDDDAKKQLLLALEAALEPLELSRWECLLAGRDRRGRSSMWCACTTERSAVVSWLMSSSFG
jgi:hypothetical protein